MRHILLAALAGTFVLAGCSTLSGGSERGSQLVGQRIQLVPAAGQPSILSFGGNGVVRSSFGRRSAVGRWWVQGRRLCFLWAGSFRECWPYRRPFPHRRQVRLRSDRGNLVWVTLL
jgi:hypothetical protein